MLLHRSAKSLSCSSFLTVKKTLKVEKQMNEKNESLFKQVTISPISLLLRCGWGGGGGGCQAAQA